MTGLRKQAAQILQWSFLINGSNLRSRQHDVFNAHIFEAKEISEHMNLFAGQTFIITRLFLKHIFEAITQICVRRHENGFEFSP